MTDGSAGAIEGQPQGVTRVLVTAWLVLVAITILEVSLILIFKVSPAVRVTALILLALMKASLIGAYYMNLRLERLAIVYVAALPLILLTLTLISILPDAASLLKRP